MRVASVTMYYSFQYGCLTYCPTDVPRTVPSRVRVSSVTDAPHVLSYGYHPYCPTDVTHTVLRMSHLWMSPILSYVYHPYCPTYITHIVLRISHLYWLRMSPILSYGCPTYAVLRMSPMLSQHMSGSLALRMSQPYRPTGVIHTVSR